MAEDAGATTWTKKKVNLTKQTNNEEKKQLPNKLKKENKKCIYHEIP